MRCLWMFVTAVYFILLWSTQYSTFQIKPMLLYHNITITLAWTVLFHSLACYEIKPVPRKSRFRGKSSEGGILQFLLIQRSCRLLRALSLSHLCDGHLGLLEWRWFGVYVDVLSGFGYWNRILKFCLIEDAAELLLAPPQQVFYSR